MRTVDEVQAMQEWSGRQIAADERVALVPTMGYLHEGHLALVRAARARADRVVVSLFVNPSQFGPNEDFNRYPRDIERDAALCRAEKVDVLFVPSVDEMYPPGCAVFVDEDRVARMLEGASRPGHFRGVLTVVAKLYLAVQPQTVFFGEKDAQQLFLVRQMTRDLLFPITVHAVPTVREPDGLAKSSRNVYLLPVQREQAVVLSQALKRADDAYRAGERSADALRSVLRDMVTAQPLARIDYIELVSAETFEPIQGQVDGSCRAVLAVRFGDTRLIDNALLGSSR